MEASFLEQRCVQITTVTLPMNPGCHKCGDLPKEKLGEDGEIIPAKKLMVCSKCKVARYCSKECQKAAWKSHKIECPMYATMANEKSVITRALNLLNSAKSRGVEKNYAKALRLSKEAVKLLKEYKEKEVSTKYERAHASDRYCAALECVAYYYDITGKKEKCHEASLAGLKEQQNRVPLDPEAISVRSLVIADNFARWKWVHRNKEGYTFLSNATDLHTDEALARFHQLQCYYAYELNLYDAILKNARILWSRQHKHGAYMELKGYAAGMMCKGFWLTKKLDDCVQWGQRVIAFRDENPRCELHTKWVHGALQEMIKATATAQKFDEMNVWYKMLRSENPAKAKFCIEKTGLARYDIFDD